MAGLAAETFAAELYSIRAVDSMGNPPKIWPCFFKPTRLGRFGGFIGFKPTPPSPQF